MNFRPQYGGGQGYGQPYQQGYGQPYRGGQGGQGGQRYANVNEVEQQPYNIQEEFQGSEN